MASPLLLLDRGYSGRRSHEFWAQSRWGRWLIWHFMSQFAVLLFLNPHEQQKTHFWRHFRGRSPRGVNPSRNGCLLPTHFAGDPACHNHFLLVIPPAYQHFMLVILPACRHFWKRQKAKMAAGRRDHQKKSVGSRHPLHEGLRVVF